MAADMDKLLRAQAERFGADAMKWAAYDVVRELCSEHPGNRGLEDALRRIARLKDEDAIAALRGVNTSCHNRSTGVEATPGAPAGRAADRLAGAVHCDGVGSADPLGASTAAAESR